MIRSVAGKLLIPIAAAVTFVAGCGGGSSSSDVADISVAVVSSPADAVTGGAALLQVKLPAGVAADDMTVTVNGTAIANPFVADAKTASWIGVVPSLADGESTVQVAVRPSGFSPRHVGSVTLTNSTTTVGVLERALQPLICRTASLGLAAPSDADCNAPTTYTYLYKSTDAAQTALLPYDPAHPASDVATTTNDQGITMPFVVRDERGVIDRTVYDIVVLFDPSKPWSATAPQAGWNHKLLWRFGGGCTPGHVQASNSAQAVDNAYNALGLGFAVATSGLSVLGNHCDTTLSAESTLTIKSHLAVNYGLVRYTMSDGSSGGSIQQHALANNYPGLLNGIIMSGTSFPDGTTIGTEFADCHLLRNYFGNISSALWADAAQQAAVMGKPDLSTCTSVDTNFFGLGYSFENVVYDPTIGCTSPDNAVPPTFTGTLQAPGLYNALTNPGGVRCTYYDSLIAIVGKRASDGFANRGYDNIGVQYGLAALKAGAISMAQFIDLNQHVGGITIDNAFQTARSQADAPALPAAYQSGQVIDGKSLGDVPIIAYQSYNNQIFHDSFYNWAVRARLMAANGTSANQVIWTFLGAPGSFPLDAFQQMDAWLAAIEADASSDAPATKVARAKPAATVDACLIDGAKVTDAATCANTYPNFSDPRIVAGADLTDMVLKCQLKPVAASDYGSVSAEQLAQLQAIFASGVCDYSLPGVGQQAVKVWSRWP